MQSVGTSAHLVAHASLLTPIPTVEPCFFIDFEQSRQACETNSYVWNVMEQVVQEACVPVSVRGCKPGEVIGTEHNVCDPCPLGMYSFDNRSCQTSCPDNAKCFGAMVVPGEGYWQSAANATFIHQCPNQGACKYALLETQADCLP